MLQSLSCGERDPAPLQSERPVGKAGKQAFDPTADREHSKGEMAPAGNAGAMLQKRIARRNDRTLARPVFCQGGGRMRLRNARRRHEVVQRLQNGSLGAKGTGDKEVECKSQQTQLKLFGQTQ